MKSGSFSTILVINDPLIYTCPVFLFKEQVHTVNNYSRFADDPIKQAAAALYHWRQPKRDVDTRRGERVSIEALIEGLERAGLDDVVEDIEKVKSEFVA